MRLDLDTRRRRCGRVVHLAAGLLAVLSERSLAVPLLTFSPLTPTHFNLPANATAVVSYRVTHQAQATRSWQWQSIPGVTQMTGAAGECGDPFTLAFQQSCQLDLRVDASQLGSGVQGGPVVCIAGSPLQCAQPAAADALDITVVAPPDALFADGFEAP